MPVSGPGFLVLAAGSSRRFGGHKLLATLPSGDSILESTLEQLPQGFPVHVVCRPQDEGVINLLERRGTQFSRQPCADLGMGNSIALGVQHTSEWPGWIICLADMPWVTTPTYELIAQTLQANCIVVPVVEDSMNQRQGNPVGFGSQFRHELQQLHGDQGGKRILQANNDKVRTLMVKDPGILLDIDYPDDINKHAN